MIANYFPNLSSPQHVTLPPDSTTRLLFPLVTTVVLRETLVSRDIRHEWLSPTAMVCTCCSKREARDTLAGCDRTSQFLGSVGAFVTMPPLSSPKQRTRHGCACHALLTKRKSKHESGYMMRTSVTPQVVFQPVAAIFTTIKDDFGYISMVDLPAEMNRHTESLTSIGTSHCFSSLRPKQNTLPV